MSFYPMTVNFWTMRESIYAWHVIQEFILLYLGVFPYAFFGLDKLLSLIVESNFVWAFYIGKYIDPEEKRWYK